MLCTLTSLSIRYSTKFPSASKYSSSFSMSWLKTSMRKLHQPDPIHDKIELSRETLLLQGTFTKKKLKKSIARILPHRPPQSCLKTKRSALVITLGRIRFSSEGLLHCRERFVVVMKRSVSRGRKDDVIVCV